MNERTNVLAQRAVSIWSGLSVSRALIVAAKRREMRELAARRDVDSVTFSVESRALFDQLRPKLLSIDNDVLELVETKSISYHGPEFFLEVIPRRYSLTLLLALDFGEIEDASGLAQDATQWRFFVNARHQGGVAMNIGNSDAIEKAIPLIKQAFASSRE